MMPLPSGMGSRDIGQWLQGGWFAVERNDAVEVCNFEGMSEDGDRLMVRAANGDGFRVEQSEVRAHWPMCGAVNLEGYAAIIERSSRQQYRRTYNSRCLTIAIPRKWDVMKASGTTAHVTADTPSVVLAAFNPVYYSYSDALAKLSEGWVTVALNPHLIIAGDGDTMLVYYRGTLVGRVEGYTLVPIGVAPAQLRRLLKFFDGRITL